MNKKSFADGATDSRPSPGKELTGSFSETHIDQNCETLSGVHENKLFFGCTFKKLNELTLKDCVLMNSRFLTDRIEDALGLTLTLDCHSFEDVECSPLIFDLLLLLLAKTKGNTDKRRKLIELVGRDRAYEILKQLEQLEPR